ncbi:hypothetical protein ACFFGH_11085 [Lysobacter korlensis]|uniref:Uncharacterized protein n=1 Tax=Lysobacter korlensis TaxID=553636 RepID=A0ABV6RP76_9GAMM
MRRVTYVDESVIVGEEFGMLILEYAASLARNNTSEPLHFRALNDEGEVETAFLLGPASQIVVVKTNSLLPEPENSEAEDYMRSRIRQLTFPTPHPVGDDESVPPGED